MVYGLRSFSATFDTVALENQLVDLDQQEDKLKEEMPLRLATIREDCARVQQTLDAARDFAEPFETLLWRAPSLRGECGAVSRDGTRS